MDNLDSYLGMANGHLSDIEKEFIPKYVDVDVAPPSVMTCRLKVLPYYGNAEHVMNEMIAIVRSYSPNIRWLILRFDSISDVDHVAAKMLMELAYRMAREQVVLVFTELSADLGGFLSDSGVLESVGLDRVFPSVDTALAAVKRCTPSAGRGAEDVVGN